VHTIAIARAPRAPSSLRNIGPSSGAAATARGFLLSQSPGEDGT
jgi:hypothetical protein